MSAVRSIPDTMTQTKQIWLSHAAPECLLSFSTWVTLKKVLTRLHCPCWHPLLFIMKIDTVVRVQSQWSSYDHRSVLIVLDSSFPPFLLFHWVAGFSTSLFFSLLTNITFLSFPTHSRPCPRPRPFPLPSLPLHLSGGETHFPHLNISVTPKKGRALLWPSTFDYNQERVRTY